MGVTKEMVVAYFEVSSRHLLGWSETKKLNLSQNNSFLNRDLNPESLARDVSLLTAPPRRLSFLRRRKIRRLYKKPYFIVQKYLSYGIQ